MGAPVLQFKRGQFSNLPGLRAGEPGFTTDKFDLYVGIDSTTSSNKFFGSHRYWNRETATVGSSVRVVEGSNNGSNYIELKSPNSLAQNVTYTLPATDVANGILVSDGSGNLSYTTTVTGSGSGLSGGSVPLASLDIDGGTDIGAALTDGDEFIVDDGGNGTNRKVDASRIKDYVLGGGQGANFAAIKVTGISTLGFADATQLKVSGVSTFTGTVDVNGAIDADGGANIAGGLVANSAAISDLTSGRVVLAGTAGELEDSGNLTFDGSTLAVTGSQTISSNLTLTGNADFNGDLDVDGTANLDVVDIDGAVDMASTLTIAGNIDANGDLDVDGTTNLDVVDIDGAVDMASTLTIAGNIDANGDLDVDGTTNLDAVDIDGAVDMASTLTVAGQTDLNGDINLGNATSDTITPTGRFDAALVPATDGAIDLGTSTLEYKDLFIDGTAHIDTLDVDENAGIVGNATVGGTLGVTGDGTFSADVDVTGTVTANQFTGSGAGLSAGTTPITTLDIDGGTDLGGDLADGDLIVVDDGANGTNRKAAMSRVKNYVLGGGSGATFAAINVTGISTVAFVDATQLKVSGVSTFTGTVDVNGAIDADGGGNIAGGLVADTAKVSDLTDGRVVLAGTDGELEDSGNLTFNGSQLGVTGTVNASSTVTGSAFHTGAEGSAIRVTSNTISGPATITLDPAGVGDNTGKVVIAGDFQVDGTTTTVNSTTVEVTDKNILIANGAANDAAANGGGITIESGEGNKTFQFEATGDNLGSSENLNIASGKSYKINNVDTLNATTLGSAVVNSSLTNVGTLTGLTVSGNASIEGNVDLGNATSDTITATGRFDSDLVPSADGTSDLGTSDNEWQDLFIDGTAKIDTLTVDENAGVTGNLTVTGGSTFNGNVDIGNATSDTVTVTGRFDSDLVPSTDGARDLGTSTLEWKDLYLDGTAHVDTLDVDANAGIIGNATVGGTLGVTGESTLASATVSDLTSGRVVLAGTAGALEDSGNLTFNGSLLNVTGAVTSSGAVNIDDTTQSTSNTTGALIVDGGVGIAKNAHVGGTLDVDGQITSTAPLRNSTGGGLIAGVGVHSTSSAGLVTAFKFRGSGLEDFIVEDGIADIVLTGIAATTFTTSETTVATEGQTAFTVSANYTAGFVDVYLNGIRLITGVDYTETNASTITLGSGATAGDEIHTVSWKTLGNVVRVQSLQTAADLTVSGVATATGGFVGDLTGDVTGNADSATVGTTITVADESSDTTCFPLFATAATGNLGAKSGSNLTFNSNTGALSATSFAGSGSGLTAGTTPITTLDIDGATDIGADLADADLFIVDDGAGGTNRKVTFQRLSENILGGSGGATFAAVNVTGIGTFGGIIDGNGGANISGGAGLVASTAKVSDLTAGRVVLAGTDGEIEDSGNLTFNGSKLTVTGNAQVTSDLDVDGGMNVSGGESVMSSATVSDLTSGRVVLAGTSGALEDSGNLTFNGSTLAVTGAITASSNVTVSGNLTVNGTTTQINTVNTTIEDTLLELQKVDGGNLSSDTNKDVGIVMNYYDGSAKKAAVFWDDSAGRFAFGSAVTETAGVLGSVTYGGVEIGSLYVNDCAGASQVISCSGTTRSLENITIDGGSF
jgi:cytoskeletal protein CcmA (bactofilin family)